MTAKIHKQKIITRWGQEVTEYIAVKYDIIWATIYREEQKNEQKKHWVVRWVDNQKSDYQLEYFSSYKEARKRAIEIANSKIN